MKCQFCGRHKDYPCMNTRDMTDFAIAGEDACFAALEKCGWGESGERYVRAYRAANDRPLFSDCWEERKVE